MEAVLALVLALALSLLPVGAARAAGLSIQRTLQESGQGGVPSRCVLGGEKAELVFPAACALVDINWGVQCSGTVIKPRWVLTAAHCVKPYLAYVKYNAHRAVSNEGDHAPIDFLYRHPKYKVVEKEDGRGTYVTLLQHDVGLVHTRLHMALHARLPLDPVVALRTYDALYLHNEKVEMLGFGLNRELSLMQLELVYCDRDTYFYCVCAVASRRLRGPLARTCDIWSGDSGGPVVYRGVQIGVTSMGLVRNGTPVKSATNVLTALYWYADIVNATIRGTDNALSMRQLSISAAPSHSCACVVGALAAFLLPALELFAASFRLLGATCVGLVAYYMDQHYNGYYQKSELFFLLVAVAFLIGTFCLLTSCLVSLSTSSLISKTVYEVIYHGLAFLLYLAAGLTLLIEVNHEKNRYRKTEYEAYLAASIMGLVIAALYLLSTFLANRTYRGI